MHFGLVGHGLPELTGVGFLQGGHELFPGHALIDPSFVLEAQYFRPPRLLESLHLLSAGLGDGALEYFCAFGVNQTAVKWADNGG